MRARQDYSHKPFARTDYVSAMVSNRIAWRCFILAASATSPTSNDERRLFEDEKPSFICCYLEETIVRSVLFAYFQFKKSFFSLFFLFHYEISKSIQ